MEQAKEKKRYTIEALYALPEDAHKELIDGELYDMAPATKAHQRLVGRLHLAIGNYIAQNGGNCEVFMAPFGVQPDKDDDSTLVAPDISIICDGSKLEGDICVGAPDWIIEIASPTNRRQDYLVKPSWICICVQGYGNIG